MASRRVLAVGIICLAAVVVVGAIALAPVPRRQPTASGATRSARVDPVFLAARGWHADHTHRPRVPQAPVATAATIPLLDAPGAAPTRTVAALPAHGLIEQALVYGRAPRSWDRRYPVRALPLRLADGVVQRGWEGDPRRGDSRVVLLGRVRGIVVEVDVYFGTGRPSGRLRMRAQRELTHLRLPSS